VETDAIKDCNQTWAENHFTLTEVVKKLEKQELAIAGLQADNLTLKDELAALKASSPAPTLQAPAALTAPGFTWSDAACLKAEIYSNISAEINKFEAMITAKTQGPAKLLPRPTRKPREGLKVSFAAPAPSSSAPNIIDLANSLPASPVGLLGEGEVNKPSSSKPAQPPPRATPVASKKGKEPAPPTPESEAGSFSDDADSDADELGESAENILARQVALNVAKAPPSQTIPKPAIRITTRQLTAPSVPNTPASKPAATQSPPQVQTTPVPAPTSTIYQGFTEEQQGNWLYISNRHVPFGEHAG
jgi:hypothetical protein